MEIDDILLKKWELLWNHYKLQNESIEKRRNYLWIIQALIFTGWYYSFKDKFIIISLLLSIVGFLISLMWIFVLNRERLSVLITEMSLRDVEVEWNILINDIEFNRFILDKELLYQSSTHQFKYKNDNIGRKKRLEKYSASNIMNKRIPTIFMIVWLLLIIFIIIQVILCA